MPEPWDAEDCQGLKEHEMLMMYETANIYFHRRIGGMQSMLCNDVMTSIAREKLTKASWPWRRECRTKRRVAAAVQGTALRWQTGDVLGHVYLHVGGGSGASAAGGSGCDRRRGR